MGTGAEDHYGGDGSDRDGDGDEGNGDNDNDDDNDIRYVNTGLNT